MADDETNFNTATGSSSGSASSVEVGPSEPDEKTAASDLLRAFEDEKLGPDAVRINGKIERGHGSKFRGLSEEDQAKYAALEKLVEAEQKLADATTAHRQAEEAYEAAIDAVDAFDKPEPEASADA